jgi:hypothetical protein
VTRAGYAPWKIKEFDQLFFRIGPLRDLRNHIAHGILRVSLAPDGKTLVQTLSMPRDLDGSNSSAARHLEFAELEDALGTLTELIEQFQHLAGFKAATDSTTAAL